MKGDFTRSTFRRGKHYRSVRMQQGRVQMDADFNEQVDIQNYLDQSEVRDVIGACGVPQTGGGFAIGVKPDGSDITISPGHIYVDGLLCELDAETTYTLQPDYPNPPHTTPGAGGQPPKLNLPAGTYSVYLDVWQRHITAIEDPFIREVALGGPDTATRAQTIWQVNLLEAAANANCASDVAFPESTGKLSARAEPAEITDEECSVEPGAGYRRLENQLYRVEVHKEGDLGVATFKWSRDNGSILTEWKGKTGNDLTVGGVGRDKVLGFATGQWVELTDDARELRGKPGTLVRLTGASGETLTIDPATTTDPVELSAFSPTRKVRRWDSPGDAVINIPAGNDGFIPLEDGVEVKFESGFYRTGDYWLIPARTVKADIEWPWPLTNPQAPHGIRHHYCRLAVLTFNAAISQVQDCRPLFPSLTEMTNLYYVSGDGQEARPGDPLPQLLQVGVFRGKWPVKNAVVRFTAQDQGRVAKDKPSLTGAGNTFEVTTSDDGIATCAWRLDPNPLLSSQQLQATLLTSAGMPIRFTANHSQARDVAYNPEKCNNLAGVTNVQDAIDRLCQTGRGGGCCVVVGEGGEFEKLEEAIRKLLEGGRTDICICLLPGVYGLPNGFDISVKPEDPPVHIKIVGCGAGSQIKLEGTVPLNFLASFTVRDVAIEATNEIGSVVFNGCDEIEINTCHIASRFPRPLLEFRGAERILIENSVIASIRGNPGRPLTIFKETPEISRVFESADHESFRRGVILISESTSQRPARARLALAKPIQQAFREVAKSLTSGEQESYERLIADLEAPTLAAHSLVNTFKRIRNAAGKAVPGTAIIFADGGADAVMANNEISGVISLYGNPELNAGDLRQLVELIKKGEVTLIASTGSLHMRNNRLTRIVVAEDLLKQVEPQRRLLRGLFGSMFLTDNIFEAGENQLIARHQDLTSNLFAFNRPDAGTVTGDTAIYMGNHAPNDIRLFNFIQPSKNERAANLIINIV